MPYSLVDQTSAGSSDQLEVTTPGIDTTGATLLVAFLSTTSGTPPTIDDSKGNTWTRLTGGNVGGGEHGVFFYCASPTVGAAHTVHWITDFAGTTRPSLWFGAFSGASATPFDQETGSTTFGTTIQPGSQTPSEDDCLVVQAVSFNTSTASPSISSGYTFAGTSADYQDDDGSTKRGLAVAHIIQTTAGATNPTWTLSLTSVVARSASFKAAAGGGGGGNRRRRVLLCGVAA